MRQMAAYGRADIKSADAQSALYIGLADVTYYAPYSNSFDSLKGLIRRSDTHEVVDLEHKTLNERLRGYFQHREHKSYPPDGIGLLRRKHVHVVEHVYIGKESQEIKEDTAEESGYVIGYENTNEFWRGGLSEVLKSYDMPTLSHKTGIPKRTLHDIRSGAEPTDKTRKLLIGALITPTVPPLERVGPGAKVRLRTEPGAKAQLKASTGAQDGLPGLSADIRTIGPSRLSKQTGLGRQAIYNILNGATPRPTTLVKLRQAVRVIKGQV